MGDILRLKAYSTTASSLLAQRITPTLGFSFFFYSKEHEPPHVHVEGASGAAIFDWDGEKFILREKYKIKSNDLKRITSVIEENADIILKRWQSYFGKEASDEDYKDLV